MSADPPFKLALLQMQCSSDVHANMAKSSAMIRDAARQGAQVICTPELFRSLYFCQHEDPVNFDLAETIPGPTTAACAQLAQELGVVLVVSLFERRAPGLYHNATVVIDADGSLLGTYRKMHIPDDPLYYEKYYFTPGDAAEGFRTFQTRFGRIGVLICWDQWFPEAARLTALQDCSVLFYPTAIAWHPREKATFGPAQVEAWQIVQRAHAIANGVYVAAPNRVGLEKIPAPSALSSSPHAGPTPHTDGGEGLEFFGSSFIADPFGRMLQQASCDREQILLATIDPDLQEQTRRNWPFLRDRRIDAYGNITKRFAT